MSRNSRVVIAVVALAAVVLTAASVATAKPGSVEKSGSGCTMVGVKTIEKFEGKMAEALKKCDKAVVAIYEKYEKEFVAIHEKHEGKKIEIAEKIEGLGREIDEITKADEPDISRLESRLKKISDLRFELTKLRFRMYKEARSLVDEGDRAALDRHFAMQVGCCGGAGMADAKGCFPGGMPGHCAGKVDMKACCPGGMPGHGAGKVDMKGCSSGGMPSHCAGKVDMKAWCPGGMPGHCAGKVDMKTCCPGFMGHTSMTSPRVMFIGEKDGHADVQVLGDVRGVLGCLPGIPGEKRIEVLLDEEDDAMGRIELLLDDEHDVMRCIQVLVDDANVQADARRIITRIRGVPGDETDDLIWMGRGGSVGPL